MNWLIYWPQYMMLAVLSVIFLAGVANIFLAKTLTYFYSNSAFVFAIMVLLWEGGFFTGCLAK